MKKTNDAAGVNYAETAIGPSRSAATKAGLVHPGHLHDGVQVGARTQGSGDGALHLNGKDGPCLCRSYGAEVSTERNYAAKPILQVRPRAFLGRGRRPRRRGCLAKNGMIGRKSAHRAAAAGPECSLTPNGPPTQPFPSARPPPFYLGIYNRGRCHRPRHTFPKVRPSLT